MTTIIATLWAILSVTYVIFPVMAHQKKQNRRQLLEDYRRFQIHTVRKYCQPLQHLSYEEIRESYNVSGTYDKVGKKFKDGF